MVATQQILGRLVLLARHPGIAKRYPGPSVFASCCDGSLGSNLRQNEEIGVDSRGVFTQHPAIAPIRAELLKAVLQIISDG